MQSTRLGQIVWATISAKTWRHLIALSLVVFLFTYITYNERWPWQTFCFAGEGRRNLPKWLGVARDQRILLWNLVEHFNESVVTGKQGKGKRNNTCRILNEWKDERFTDAIVVPPRELINIGVWREEMGRIKRIVSHRDFVLDRTPVLPKYTKSWQVLVMWHMESPAFRLPVPLSYYRGFFQLTATYLDDENTDIHVPHGKVIPRIHRDTNYMNTSDIMGRKSGLVAWINDCTFETERTNIYVTELSKYVDVDVYGHCGIPMDCEISLSERRYNCTEDIYIKYKFFMAFEVATCKEYVTDIMFDPLKNNIVPIAVGGANFAQQLPPKSFINADDFASAQELARYLKRLDENPNEYLSYFKWKETYSVSTDTRVEAFSRLCDILHDESYMYKSKCFNPADYWSTSRYCPGEEQLLFTDDFKVVCIFSLLILCVIKVTTRLLRFRTVIVPYISCVFRVSTRRRTRFIRSTLSSLFNRQGRRPMRHVRRRTYQLRKYHWQEDEDSPSSSSSSSSPSSSSSSSS